MADRLLLPRSFLHLDLVPWDRWLAAGRSARKVGSVEMMTATAGSMEKMTSRASIGLPRLPRIRRMSRIMSMLVRVKMITSPALCQVDMRKFCSIKIGSAMTDVCQYEFVSY